MYMNVCIYVYIRIYIHNDVSVHMSDDANIAGPETGIHVYTCMHICI
jgi:hypothetical protein